MIENWKQYGPRAFRSGLIYGAGFILGSLMAAFLFSILTLEIFSEFGDAARLLIGLILALVISGLAGGVGGLVGGYSLPRLDQERGHWGYAWRSAISIALPYGLSLYPILLVFSLLSFFNADDPGTMSTLMLMIIGVVFGVMASILMGLLTIGWRGMSSLIWAGAAGFGIGGTALGISIRIFINSIRDAGVGSGQGLWLLLGFFIFGLAGGTAWTYVFARLQEMERVPGRAKRGRIRYVVAILFLLFTFVLLRPAIAAVGDLLTPQSADLARVFDKDTEGVHWSDPITLASADNLEPAVFASGDKVASAWYEQQTILYATGLWDRIENVTVWESAQQVTSAADSGSAPQIVLDAEDQVHIVWIENDELLTAVCAEGSCNEPLTVAGRAAPACASGNGVVANPVLSINEDDILLAVWQHEGGGLVYSDWSAGETPPIMPSGCIPQSSEQMINPRLAAMSDGRFVLAYQSEEEEGDFISIVGYSGGEWDSAVLVGKGHLPSVYAARDDQIHVAWCDQDGKAAYWSGGNLEIVSDLPCLSRPDLAEDSTGNMHISWYADQVENSTGQISSSNIVYESIRNKSAWERPAIAATVADTTQAAMTESGGDLHLMWVDGNDLQYASQLQYDCDYFELSTIGQTVNDVAALPSYRTEDNPVPYCRNQYDRLIIAPNPDPAYSDEPISQNGPFDRLGELVKVAEYEVLFSNMWYDEDQSGNSPGRVLADAVAVLYSKLEANPEQYPRGITVRILLGHPPESTRGEFAGQIWHVLDDLREAGVPEMENEELGWSVEVANFEGTLPHSHIKSLVVDGKIVVGAGFNMSYDHFDVDHPSELGNGRFDLGMQVTGPVAQDARRMFDDLWEGADRLHCSDFYPSFLPWQSSCLPRQAASDHVPEVMRYFLTEGDTSAFSMYRNEARDEADQQVIAALSSAEESIDAIHVNFTSEMICDLNLLYDQVCTSDQLLPYMEAMLNAAENNDANIRVIIKGAPIDGVESGVHLTVLNDALIERGLSDRVEVRLFDGPMHPKTTLIDDEFLIVGSQNYHYSAFGDGIGLAEYSLGVEDNKAVEDFKRMFEYQWERASQTE